MDKNLYIGVMSGTSLDGIDIALCEITSEFCKLIMYKEFNFDSRLKQEILNLISGECTLQQIGEIDKKLGLLYAKAINAFLEEKAIDSQTITAIGLHGQTLWHSPDGDFPFSMQLGCQSTVVAQTGIRVVGDFRSMDIANGGQGAPFAPAFHKEIFSSLSENTAVLNIGGMANLTLLSNSVKGWDTGCGNVLLDMWINKCQNKSYDKDGAFARSGTLNQELLDSLLNDPYFQKEPPKSTGREYFNETFLANHLPFFNAIKDEDIQRTLLELTAKSIANDIAKTSTQVLIVCGGGAKNSFLMQRLQELTNIDVKTSDQLGINSDALEAMAFAWFAYKRVHNEEVDLKSITGAKKNSLLGAIYG